MGPQHGYGIGRAMRMRSDNLLRVEHGSLYPALHRLERQGWIESEWGLSEISQRAKFYRLTARGRKQLAAEESRWDLFVKRWVGSCGHRSKNARRLKAAFFDVDRMPSVISKLSLRLTLPSKFTSESRRTKTRGSARISRSR